MTDTLIIIAIFTFILVVIPFLIKFAYIASKLYTRWLDYIIGDMFL